MKRILLSICLILTGCSPAPQKVAMTSPRTTQGPADESAAHPDSPAEAQGRRILSTAFVRLGPGEHLMVELHNGDVLNLRDVTMRQADYCGVQVSGTSAPAKYCGGYADVAAARPGGAPNGGPTPGGRDATPVGTASGT